MGYETQVPGEKSAMDVDVEGSNGHDYDGRVADAKIDENGPVIPALVDDGDGTTHMQDGVKDIEAVTSAWTKKTLWVMMVLYVLAHRSPALSLALSAHHSQNA